MQEKLEKISYLPKLKVPAMVQSLTRLNIPITFDEGQT